MALGARPRPLLQHRSRCPERREARQQEQTPEPAGMGGRVLPGTPEGVGCRDTRVLCLGEQLQLHLGAPNHQLRRSGLPLVLRSCLLHEAGGPGLQLRVGQLQLHSGEQILPPPQEHREAAIHSHSLGGCSPAQEGRALSCSLEQESQVCTVVGVPAAAPKELLPQLRWGRAPTGCIKCAAPALPPSCVLQPLPSLPYDIFLQSSCHHTLDSIYLCFGPVTMDVS